MITIDEIKKQVEDYARVAFSSETFPHAMLWDEGGDEVKVMALAVPVPMAVQTVAMAGCFAAAIMNEAWGAEKDDIISINIDHPDGVVFGRAEVDNEGDPRVGAFTWTTEVEPLGREPIRFPRFSNSGRFIKLRVRKAGAA